MSGPTQRRTFGVVVIGWLEWELRIAEERTVLAPVFEEPHPSWVVVSMTAQLADE